MTDASTLSRQIAALRRPRLLIRAARFGVLDYRRERDLRRMLGPGALPPAERAVPLLLEEEDRLESLRLAGDAAYGFARHIDVLIALLAEARTLPRAEAAPSAPIPFPSSAILRRAG